MTGAEFAYDAARRDGVLRVTRPGTEWLSTGWNGGRRVAEDAYNISVPEGWGRTDLGAYVDERLARAGFATSGDSSDEPPALLTGVDVADARGARCGPVTVYATAGLSNPAALPMDPDRGDAAVTSQVEEQEEAGETRGTEPGTNTGTVNLIVCTTRALESGALANLIAVAAEAKAATLLAEANVPGTTTDAIVVGHDPTGEPAAFSGSGTAVGAAARACVREAVASSLEAHYEDADATLPSSAADATYGVSTDVRARTFRVPPAEPDSSATNN